ncbi:alkaline phosphatase family protein, partial [Nocardia sp. NPDC003263]
MSSGSFAGLNRRQFLAKAMAAGAVGTLATWANPIIDRAFAADPAGMGGLGDIEHFVLLMQENRSFDHYFGTLSGVRGFGEESAAWRQYGWSPGIGPTADGFVGAVGRENPRRAPPVGVLSKRPRPNTAGLSQGVKQGA